jgi:Uma2 family endonuclease
MSAQVKKLYTPEEYLALERASLEKHEYFNGEIFPLGAGLNHHGLLTMTGASFRHTTLVGSVFAALRSAVRKQGCSMHTSDLKVKTPSGLYAYPDIVIVCGKPEFLDGEFDTLLNPIAIIEVLSNSTSNYDRTKKFDHYRSIPTLNNYILVEQAMMRVEHFTRTDNPQVPPEQTLWGFRSYTNAADILSLSGMEAALALSDVYEDIDFTDAVNV